MKKISLVPLIALSLLVFVACGAPTPGTQTVSGTAALETFPTPPNSVRAVSSSVVIEVPLLADGAFSLDLPTGQKYKIEFTGASSPSSLVMPRNTGTVDSVFLVRASSAPFDLGTVRYIGDPSSATFHFTTRAADTSGDSDTDQYECEDGVDPNTGEVCVDDNDEQGAGECASETDSDTDQTECEDGIDPVTGLECDGGPAANKQDGNEGNAEEDSGAEKVSDAAVADHNLPPSVGCPGDADNDNHECENGIDPATGLECDGGPTANTQDNDGSEGD